MDWLALSSTNCGLSFVCVYSQSENAVQALPEDSGLRHELSAVTLAAVEDTDSSSAAFLVLNLTVRSFVFHALRYHNVTRSMAFCSIPGRLSLWQRLYH